MVMSRPSNSRGFQFAHRVETIGHGRSLCKSYFNEVSVLIPTSSSALLQRGWRGHGMKCLNGTGNQRLSTLVYNRVILVVYFDFSMLDFLEYIL